MKANKDEIKKIIRALLLSARHGLTVNELCSEYTAVTCKAIPYKELGYFSAMDMVKDMPDVVRPIFLSGGVLLLKGVADTSTAHINELVRNQKSVGYNSRITRPSQVKKSAKPVIPGDFLRKRIEGVLRIYPKGIELCYFNKAYQNQYGKRLDPHLFGCTSVKEVLLLIPDIVSIKYKGNFTFVYAVPKTICFKEDSTFPQLQSSHPEQIVNSIEKLTKTALPESIKMEIQVVLSKWKYGIWASRFLFEYEVCMKKALNIQQYGFNSVIELMSKIPDIVRIERPVQNGDWFLIPVSGSEKLQKIVIESNRVEKCYCKVGEVISIYISYIISPSSFWFQNVSALNQLETLMEEMNSFYNSEQSTRYRADKLKPGQVCCALYEDNRWYRAVVKNVLPEEKVCVFYVDYGNESTINMTSLRLMTEAFFVLPFQSFQAKLGDITPHEFLWSEKAISRFFKLTQDQQLSAKILKVDCRMSLQLFCNTDEQELSISCILANEGYGILQSIAADTTNELHKVRGTTQQNKGSKEFSSLYQDCYKTLQHVSYSSCQLVNQSENNTANEEKLSDTQPNQTVKAIKVSDNLTIHIIPYRDQVWVSSAEVSSLFWNADILRQMLRQKGLSLTKEVITFEDNKDLYSSIEKHKVKGCVSCEEKNRFVTVYKLSDVLKLFSVFKTIHQNSQAVIEMEVQLFCNTGKVNVTCSEQTNEAETEMLKLQALKFRKKRLYLSMITNSASPSTMDEIRAIEKEIACLM